MVLNLVDLSHCLHLLLCELALALLCSLGCTLALKQGTAVLVQLQLGDDALAGVNTDAHGGTYRRYKPRHQRSRNPTQMQR